MRGFFQIRFKSRPPNSERRGSAPPKAAPVRIFLKWFVMMNARSTGGPLVSKDFPGVTKRKERTQTLFEVEPRIAERLAFPARGLVMCSHEL